MHKRLFPKQHQNGNILFLILLAVVLFAALTYAVTSSMRGGGNNASSENAEVEAANIANFVALLKLEVQRLILLNNCAVENLDWRTDLSLKKNGGANHSGDPAPIPKSGCSVFSDYGGPVSPQVFDGYGPEGFWPSGSNQPRPGHFKFAYIDKTNSGTSALDVAILINDLRPAICKKLINIKDTEDLPTEGLTDNNGILNAPDPITVSGYYVIDDPKNLVTEFSVTEGSGKCNMVAVIIER